MLSMMLEEGLTENDATEGTRCIGMDVIVITFLQKDLFWGVIYLLTSPCNEGEKVFGVRYLAQVFISTEEWRDYARIHPH